MASADAITDAGMDVAASSDVSTGAIASAGAGAGTYDYANISAEVYARISAHLYIWNIATPEKRDTSAAFLLNISHIIVHALAFEHIASKIPLDCHNKPSYELIRTSHSARSIIQHEYMALLLLKGKMLTPPVVTRIFEVIHVTFDQHPRDVAEYAAYTAEILRIKTGIVTGIDGPFTPQELDLYLPR
jgi:hypothetical protein